MGKMQRAKGARGEREVCRLFDAHGLHAIRSAPLQAARASNAPDVLVRELPTLWTEVKRMKRVPVSSSFRQAIRDCDTHDRSSVPLLAFREDGTEWLACLRLSDLLDLIEAARDGDVLPPQLQASQSTLPSSTRSLGA